MAFYNVWSRPFMQRSSALGFLTVGMGAGAAALAFIFWVLALERATPTRVANTMTVNPIAAGLLAAVLVNEPITVFAGIWIATTQPARV
jgi:drug/metabolite transporter (DMT)-like permease